MIIGDSEAQDQIRREVGHFEGKRGGLPTGRPGHFEGVSGHFEGNRAKPRQAESMTYRVIPRHFEGIY